jgi:hypothetical protein
MDRDPQRLSLAKPPKQRALLHHRDPARRSRNRISDYLPQRRKGRKEKNIYPNLAFLAPWREKCPNPRCFVSWNLPKPRKFSSIVVRSSQRSEYFFIKNSLLCALSASAVSSRISFVVIDCFTSLLLCRQNSSHAPCPAELAP